jgi:cytochrome c oxidase subunit I
MSVVGALILLTSGVLLLIILIHGQMAPRRDDEAYRFAVPVYMPVRLPVALNGFGLWLFLMVGLTLLNYGYPIAQLMVLKETNVPVVYVGANP